MTTKTIILQFSDHELAVFLSECATPKWIKIHKPSGPVIRAAQGMDIIVNLGIEIHIQHVALGAVALFLAKEIRAYLQKRKQEHATINDKKLKPEAREILRLIKQDIANEKARDAQWAQDHKQQVKKRVVKKRKKPL